MYFVHVLTYGQVEEVGRPDDAEETIHVLEHGLEHLVERRRRAHLHRQEISVEELGSISEMAGACILGLARGHGTVLDGNVCSRLSQSHTTYLVLRVEAGVDDAVHVEVQVVVDAIGRPGGFPSRRRRRLVDVVLGGDDDVGVLAHEPLVEGRHPHGVRRRAPAGGLELAPAEPRSSRPPMILTDRSLCVFRNWNFGNYPHGHDTTLALRCVYRGGSPLVIVGRVALCRRERERVREKLYREGGGARARGSVADPSGASCLGRWNGRDMTCHWQWKGAARCVHVCRHARLVGSPPPRRLARPTSQLPEL